MSYTEFFKNTIRKKGYGPVRNVSMEHFGKPPTQLSVEEQAKIAAAFDIERRSFRTGSPLEKSILPSDLRKYERRRGI